MNILAGYTHCVFEDFESFLRTEVYLVEDDIRLVPNLINSDFIFHKIPSGIYSLEELSEILSKDIQFQKGTNHSSFTEHEKITMQNTTVLNSSIET